MPRKSFNTQVSICQNETDQTGALLVQVAAIYVIWSQTRPWKPHSSIIFLQRSLKTLKMSHLDNKNKFELLPFGSRRRICRGMTFPMSSIELTLPQLLYDFDWKLPAGIKLEDLDIIEIFSAVMRRNSDLNVIATTHIPFQKWDIERLMWSLYMSSYW